MEEMVKQSNMVFLAKSPGALREGLKIYREVEPDRKVVVILEDMDELAQYDEHSLLELFDGEDQQDNVLYLATTNHIDRISPRLLRSSRFDRKIEVGMPPLEGRMAYLNMKLSSREEAKAIAEIAEKTDGMSFGDLRELIVSVYCLKYPLPETIQRLRTAPGGVDTGRTKAYSKSWDEKKLTEALARIPKKGLVTLDEAATQTSYKGYDISISELTNGWTAGIQKDGNNVGGPSSGEESADDALAATKKWIDQRSDESAPKTVSKAARAYEQLTSMQPVDPEAVIKAFTGKLEMLGLEGISVDDVHSDLYGNTYVTMSDIDGSSMVVSFCCDELQGATAMITLGGGDQDAIVIDLDSLGPSQLNTAFGKYLNLAELAWLNKTTMLTILNAGDFASVQPADVKATKQDAYGNNLAQPAEAMSVVRGSKRSRLPIIRETQVGLLNYKQRLAHSHVKQESAMNRDKKWTRKLVPGKSKKK